MTMAGGTISMANTSAKLIHRLSVEYNLTEHCNLSCYGCDHASPLLPEKYAVVEDFARDLEALARVFHSSELRIVGGEPLLHPKLFEFLREGRRIAVADAVVLYTNGVLLHEMPDELWDLIDVLHISVYPGVKRRLDDAECARRCEAHGVKLDIDHLPEFNRTLINQRIESKKLVEAIFLNCQTALECNTVYQGRFYKCAIAPFMGARLALQGIDFDNLASDGVSLHDNATLHEDLDGYLNSRKPLAACSYCLGSSGPQVAHHQLNRRGCAAWRKEDNQADIDSVREHLLGTPWLVRGRRKLGRLLSQLTQ
ncbi:MAG: radical SAM protein [Reyranellales bacterium]